MDNDIITNDKINEEALDPMDAQIERDVCEEAWLRMEILRGSPAGKYFTEPKLRKTVLNDMKRETNKKIETMNSGDENDDDNKSDGRGLYDNINYINSLFVIINHILAIYSIQYINSYRTFFELLIQYQVCAMSITAGTHRLWSHRSYKASDPFRFMLMLFISMCNQGSIFHWVRDHRIHHKYSDTDAAPHNINNGFFFSHVGWLLTLKNEKVIEAGKKIDCSDLLNDWVVVLNKKLWPYGDLFMGYIVPSLYGYYVYDSWLKGFLIFGCLRWVILSHATWSVNSFAHTYGYKTFRNINPSDNKYVSLVSAGEGWHNWHHTYPMDYACSDEGIFLRWNPTKLFIDIFSLFGQTYDHKRIKKRIR